MTSGKNNNPMMALALAAALLATSLAQAAPAPPPPPAEAAMQAAPAVAAADLPRIAALLQQCQSAMPAAHPWRAAQAQREMFQLKVSMSYRAAASRLSPQDVAGAKAIETRAYRNLAATCAPLLI